tara:strand:+ start:114 stop:269 length:156 start_codon:yes stop_codon:yes gene_type:complete
MIVVVPVVESVFPVVPVVIPNPYTNANSIYLLKIKLLIILVKISTQMIKIL